MSWKTVKLGSLILSIAVNLVTIFKISFEIYKRIGVDMTWLIIAAIGIFCIGFYFFATKKEKESQKILDDDANKNKQEKDDELYEWIKKHNSCCDKQTFDSLEDKILHLIDHRIEFFKGAIERGEVRPKR